MRRAHTMLLISLLALAPVLSACDNFDIDKLDVFGLSEKKKLPGDRKPLFPEGVPGVSQGVPPELIKGNQPPPDATVAEPSPAQKAAEAEPPKPKVKPRLKPKPRVASQPTQIRVQPAPPGGTASQTPAPQQAQPGDDAPWPAAPAPGTFQH